MNAAKFWLWGIAVSLTGVLLARMAAPLFQDRPALLLATYLAGVTLGLAGLVVIAFGAGTGNKD